MLGRQDTNMNRKKRRNNGFVQARLPLRCIAVTRPHRQDGYAYPEYGRKYLAGLLGYDPVSGEGVETEDEAE